MDTVRSPDGTTIAFDRSGTGPPLVIVGGAFSTRRSASFIVPAFADRYTVITYDRRGRGDSTDTQPYAVQREIEDLDALVNHAGGSALLYGHSSGGALVLEAAAAGIPAIKVAAYEPPYRAPGEPRVAADYAARVQAAVDAGDRNEAARIFFLEATGMPVAVFESMTQAPYWPDMLAVAHTIPYDNAVVGDGAIPMTMLSRIAVPTLVLAGGASPSDAQRCASLVAGAIPQGRCQTLDGQEHAPDPAVVAPVLIDFFA